MRIYNISRESSIGKSMRCHKIYRESRIVNINKSLSIPFHAYVPYGIEDDLIIYASFYDAYIISSDFDKWYTPNKLISRYTVDKCVELLASVDESDNTHNGWILPITISDNSYGYRYSNRLVAMIPDLGLNILWCSTQYDNIDIKPDGWTIITDLNDRWYALLSDIDSDHRYIPRRIIESARKNVEEARNKISASCSN